MNSPLSLEQQLLQGVSFEVGPPPRFEGLCAPAQAYADWCEALVTPVREQPTEITVNVALLHLQDQFFVRYESTPRLQDHPGEQAKRKCTCLFDVSRSYFLELRALRWKVNPPLVREPAPVAPPQFEIAGVPFGIKK